MIKTLIVSFLGVSLPTFLRHILGCASSVRAAQAFYPSLNLRSSFAEPSLEQKINKGCTMGFISYLCG